MPREILGILKTLVHGNIVYIYTLIVTENS